MHAVDKKQHDDRELPRSLDQWVDTLSHAYADVHSSHVRIQALEEENAELKSEIAALKKQLSNSGTPKITEPFSLRAEEKRQEVRGKKKKRKQPKKGRRGRIATDEKIRRAETTKDVFPEGVPPDQCKFSHVRVVWRLLEGRAGLVAYRIFRGPKKHYGIIPGVLGRSEFGLEIVVELAFLVHQIGLSLDKVCMLTMFLQNLKLSKSQVDALLKQLARHWADEFEVLCTLLANSLVVHADETGWSINSVWAFLSEKARVLFFGVHKDAQTLKEILDTEKFAGLLFSDDAAVYASFTNAQKCWAHLLRKAIKLTLQDPGNARYREFADELLVIFRAANRIQRDQRLSDAGRERKVKELLRRLFTLCGPVRAEETKRPSLDHDRYLLAEELVRLALRDELFNFVLGQPAEQPNGASQLLDGTNNEAERTLRNPAQSRVTGRTSKTPAGARRTSILTSVLESLRLYLPSYTLPNVIAEISSWREKGRSCFRALLEKLNLALPKHSVLDRVLPDASG
jgi:regulator of replication initiation timing